MRRLLGVRSGGYITTRVVGRRSDGDLVRLDGVFPGPENCAKPKYRNKKKKKTGLENSQTWKTGDGFFFFFFLQVLKEKKYGTTSLDSKQT